MGCSTSKKENLTPAEFVLQSNTKQERDIEAKLAPMLQLSNNFNINQKYEFLMEVLPTLKTGQGIFETVSYKSKVQNEQLLQKREEFWETRMDGNPLIWVALRSCVESKNECSLKRKGLDSAQGGPSEIGGQVLTALLREASSFKHKHHSEVLPVARIRYQRASRVREVEGNIVRRIR